MTTKNKNNLKKKLRRKLKKQTEKEKLPVQSKEMPTQIS